MSVLATFTKVSVPSSRTVEPLTTTRTMVSGSGGTNGMAVTIGAPNASEDPTAPVVMVTGPGVTPSAPSFSWETMPDALTSLYRTLVPERSLDVMPAALTVTDVVTVALPSCSALGTPVAFTAATMVKVGEPSASDDRTPLADMLDMVAGVADPTASDDGIPAA